MLQNEEIKQTKPVDVMIVGGGLAGLTAATILSRAGRTVWLIEKSRQLGGRAHSQQRGDFIFNLGPHALYLGGGGSQILDKLGVHYNGTAPSAEGYALFTDQLYQLPASASSLLRSQLLSVGEKLQLMRALLHLRRTLPQTAVNQTVAQWVSQITNSPRVQQLLLALARLTTYANAPQDLSAAVFLQQIQLYFRYGVCYLDGGWQTLIDGLQETARSAGVLIMQGIRVTTVSNDPHLATVQLADGQTIAAGAVVLAVDPHTAARLLPHNQQLARYAATAVPVRAATLDVALRQLPRPQNNFALGIDRPLYFSNHSTAAKLGPTGSALIHVAKYLSPTQTDPEQDRLELETLLDQLQPGWRTQVIKERFLPNLTVTNDLAPVARGGLARRPNYVIPHSPNLYLAGDWVGPSGWLADASLISASQVAELVLTRSKVVLA